MDDVTRPPETFWIAPERLFDGNRIVANRALKIRDGAVVSVTETGSVPGKVAPVRLPGTLMRGFFDIQVNGGGGALLNAAPNARTVRTIARAHRRFGTTAILPTVITDRPEVTRAACQAVEQCVGRDGVIGIHIEGPHIGQARRGTHDAAFIRPLDDRTLDLVQGLRARAVPVLITLAPEAVRPGQVRALVDFGAVVSIGHTDADADAARRLLDEGAACFTHLFNAMSPMENRAPGVTGAAINSTAYCSVICDGVHVDETMVGLAVRARPEPDRMILISDAMPTVGGGDSFDLYGRTVRLLDGRLVNGEGTLAGAHTTVAEGVARMVRRIGVPLEETLRMALSNPARLMGMTDLLSLEGASLEDLIVLDDDLKCRALNAARSETPTGQG